ncbi:MAG: DUF1513 domain-containing protein [Pseudomonadota bacterium]
MVASRRSFIAGLVASGLVPNATWADAGSPAYLTAGMTPGGGYVLCGLRPDGRITFEVPLPARGHAAAAHPVAPVAVAFARRPGTYAMVLDCLDGAVKAQLTSPVGRHFYGHGAFSAEGDLLFTTENDYETTRGIVGVWDARDGYKRLGEFRSGGTGPHDIKLMPDGASVVVANGGIETHPETGRTKLNIPTMRPNLSYLSLDGAILDQTSLEDDLRRNSIRHLAVSAGGDVAFAMQWQGDAVDYPPVLGFHRRGARPCLAIVQGDATRAVRGYAGSVAFAGDAKTVAVTSPRGGVLQVFDAALGSLKRQVQIEDVCGVAAASGGFFVTNGLGRVFDLPGAASVAGVQHRIRWDNHLVAI